ncbi:MAG: hypothetical protein ACI30N_01435 [Muribaculaceae bacterium]
MKNHLPFILLLIHLIVVISCSCSRNMTTANSASTNPNLYKVTKIKKENRWYFIYLQRNDSLFKVITKEPVTNNNTLASYQKIKKNRLYDLKLLSWGEALTKSLGFNPIKDIIAYPPMGTMLDSVTFVYPEPEKNIWDFYSCPDLDGLYYLK